MKLYIPPWNAKLAFAVAMVHSSALCQCRQEVAYALENPEGLGTMFPMSGGEADGRGSIVPNPEGFSSA